jgi:hypothetical protein
MCTQNREPTDPLIGPKDPIPEQELPHALVFFLTREQRRAVLGALKQLHASRAIALLRALGVDQ